MKWIGYGSLMALFLAIIAMGIYVWFLGFFWITGSHHYAEAVADFVPFSVALVYVCVTIGLVFSILGCTGVLDENK